MSLLGPVGLLRRRVVIQTLSVVQDATGQPIETWTPSVTVWAKVTPQRGSERFTAQQVMGRSVTTFRIRYRNGLDVKTNRLVYDGKEWDIHDIREVGNQEGWDLDCTARAEA